MSKGCNYQQPPQNITASACNAIKTYSVILFLANLLQVIIGVALIIIINYYGFRMCRFMHSIQVKQLNSELSFTYIFGIQLIIAYCYGICISKKIVNGSDQMPLTYLLTLWNLYNFLFILYALFMIIKLSIAENAIITTTELYMLKGIDIYYLDPEWRLVWDSMQFHENCCGARTFSDWEHADPPYDVTLKSFRDKSTLESTMPFSCCETAVHCLNDTKYLNMCGVPDIQLDNESDFRCCGCIELFADILHATILFLYEVLACVFFLQCIIITLMRMMWTKVKYIDCSSYNSETFMNVKIKRNKAQLQSVFSDQETQIKVDKTDFESEDEYSDNSPMLVH